MEFISAAWIFFLDVVDFFLGLDKHLAEVIAEYGAWTYVILFGVVFCETGLVVTPILPGDSLLFVGGALAAKGGLNVHLLVLLLIIAAILGDAVNYWIGKHFGKALFAKPRRFLNPRHLDDARAFYDRHGGKTLVIARFLPIVRTYAPFVAGMAGMRYREFALWNVSGAIIWVVSLAYAGYFFGNIPIIKNNLTLIIIGIIFVSLVPVAWAWIQARLARVRRA